MTKEATARIKINKLLETAGWRFFAAGNDAANIRLEPSVSIKSTDLDVLGENFEKIERGFVDFLLLDAKGFPLLVLEAKAEAKNPLVGKEQARKYARSQNCRFVILSNGNLHYFWDLERGSPYVITSYPTPGSVSGYRQVTPNPQRLITEQIDDNYIVFTQCPNYQAEAGWKNEGERSAYVQVNKLRFLRPYQLNAIHSLQAALKEGKDRFLFEMATGTGKTFERIELRSPGEMRPVALVVESRANINQQLRSQRVAATEGHDEVREELRGILRALHLDRDWLDVLVDGASIHVEGLQDAVDDVIGPMVNRSVVVRAVRISPKKLRFVDIELAD